MTQNENTNPSNMNDQEFTVRHVKENYSSREKRSVNDKRTSDDANRNLEDVRNSLSSIPSQTLRESIYAPGRPSGSNIKARFDRSLLKNKGISPQVLKFLQNNCMEEHWVARRKFHDEADISQHPSYTIKNVNYNLECELHYIEAKRRYNSQFRHEMQAMIHSQSLAEQYFTHQLFSYVTFWPPMHSKAELNIYKSRFFQLSGEEKKRLHYLMTTSLSEI